MKHLKSYKLFESSWYDMKEYMNVLGDLSLSLWDKDFNVQIADEIISRVNQCIVHFMDEVSYDNNPNLTSLYGKNIYTIKVDTYGLVVWNRNKIKII
jgi:hypothetical protein